MLAAQDRFAVAREAVKKIRRQTDEAGLRQLHRQVLGVLIDAVALVKDNHRGAFAFCSRQRPYRFNTAAELGH